MNIVKATDTELVKKLSHETIKAVYPHYYPKGAVYFFLAHHSSEHIAKDIEEGNTWLIYDNDTAVGTVTVNGCEINRLFVPPEYQGKGYGKALMEFAEKLVFDKYEYAELSASLSAKTIYMKNGYVSTEYHIIDCEGGDKHCFDTMKKYKS